MKRSGGLAALAFALAWAPVAAQTPPRPSVITNPDWLRKPDNEALADAYPTIALDLLLDGRAVIDCQVLATGVLSGCGILSEQPKGLGFGAAALSMADKFRMRPATRDGVPTGGGTIRIPIRFSPPSPVEQPLAPHPPADPKTLALAKQLMDRLAEAILDQIFKSGPPEYAAPPIGADPETFKAAVSALSGALQQERRPVLDAVAEELARVMTEAELEAGLRIVAFRVRQRSGDLPPDLAQNEAVQAFMQKFDALEISPATEALGTRIMERARDDFCQSRDCLPPTERPASATPQPSASTR